MQGENLSLNNMLINYIPNVSKENNLRPDKKISCISGLKVRFLFCKVQLFRTNILCLLLVLSFYEMKLFNN